MDHESIVCRAALCPIATEVTLEMLIGCKVSIVYKVSPHQLALGFSLFSSVQLAPPFWRNLMALLLLILQGQSHTHYWIADGVAQCCVANRSNTIH